MTFKTHFVPQFLRAPEDGNGADDAAAAKAAADAAAAKSAEDAAKAAAKAAEDAAKAGEGKGSDKEAELLREVMEKKAKLREKQAELDAAAARLKEFDGIDPAEIKALLQERANAEKSAAEAKGDFERVKQMMVEEHKKEIEKFQTSLAEKEKALQNSISVIDDLTIGSAFASSSFVAGEMILTPSKARTVYGSHFDVENGKVVAYDKPRGQQNRTQLVDGSGEPLGFEDAIKKLVEVDPDRDRLIRSKLKEGAGSKTADVKAPEKKQDVGGGVSRIEAALAAKKK